MSSPVPPGLEAAVKSLRGMIDKCDSRQPRLLWRQLGRHASTLHMCAFAPLVGILSRTHPSAFDYIASEGTVPGALVRLLNRLMVGYEAESSDWQAVDRLAQLHPLLRQLASAISGAGNLYKADCNQYATQFAAALAAAQPCAALSAVVSWVPPLPPPTQLRDAERLQHLCSLVLLTLELGTNTLYLATTAGNDALLRDMLSSQLLHHTCTAVAMHLTAAHQGDPRLADLQKYAQQGAGYLAGGLGLLHNLYAAATSGHPVLTKAMMAVLLAEQAILRFLLQARAYWRQLPSSLEHDTWSAANLEVLLGWMDTGCKEAAGGASRPIHTAADLVAAVPTAADGMLVRLHESVCSRLARLLRKLPSAADRHHTFFHVAAFVRLVMEVGMASLQGQLGGGGSAGGVKRGGALPRPALTPSNVDGILKRLQSAVFLLSCLRVWPTAYADVPSAESRKEVHRQRMRARWMLTSELLTLCELLLRTAWPLSTQSNATSAVADCASQAVAVCGPLLEHPCRGAAALAAFLSMMATVRKACGSCTSALSQQRRSASTAGCSTALGAALGVALTSCKVMEELGQQQLTARPMGQQPRAGAQLALRSAALQLLPAAFDLASQLEEGCALQAGWWASLCVVARALVQLHDAGHADLTAAMGAPQVLQRLLRLSAAASPAATAGVQLASAAAEVEEFVVHALAALVKAGDNVNWLREAARLRLLGCVQEGLRRSGSNRPPTHCTLSDAEVLLWQTSTPLSVAFKLLPCPAFLARAMATVRCRIQALPDAAACGPPAPQPSSSWEVSLLDLLATLHAALFFGCCHRGCTNLVGRSEADLRLLRCGGCRLARYCSEACQQQAWGQGHKAACRAWQHQHGY